MTDHRALFILAWFFFSWRTEGYWDGHMDLQRHSGKDWTLADCDYIAMDLERNTRWRLRTSTCYPGAAEADASGPRRQGPPVRRRP